MRFALKYSLKGIKTARARALLVVFSVMLVSLLFFASLVLPIFLDNGIHDQIYKRTGDTDITISAYSTNAERNIYSFKDIERVNGNGYIEETFDYAISAFALNGRFINKDGNRIMVLPIATTYEDLETLSSSIKFVSEKPKKFDTYSVIITEKFATSNDIKVNDMISVEINSINCRLQVVGVCANNGLLGSSGHPIMFFSKAYVKERIIGGLYTSSIFNMAFLKVKDGIDKQAVVDNLHEIYPKFDIGLVFSEAENNQLIATVNYMYNICAIIGMLFSMLVIFLTMNLIFSKRVQEFSRLRTMGATNKQLITSCMFESTLYGIVGGIFASVLGFLAYIILKHINFHLDIFHGLNFEHFVLPVIFGAIISVISGFIPAIKSTRSSIRHEMIKTSGVRKRTYFVNIGVAAILIALLIVINVLKIGSAPTFLLVAFFVIMLACVYLIPMVSLLIVRFFAKIFRKRNFDAIYIEKNMYTPSTNMVSRIICFGMAFLMFLSMAISTLQIAAYSYVYDVNINAFITGMDQYEDSMIEKVKAIDGVYEAFETVKFKYINFEDSKRVIYTSYSLKPEDFEHLYGDVLIDKDEVIEKFRTTRDAIVLNESYKYLENLKVGDRVNIVLNENFVYQYEVIGFFDSRQKCYCSAVFTLEKSKDIYTDCGGSFRLGMKIDVSKHRQIEKTLYDKNIIRGDDEMGCTNENDVKSYDTFTFPVNLIRGYMALIILLCGTCLIVGMCIAIRDSAKQSRTLNQLGMNRPKFFRALFSEVMLITVISIITGIFVMETFNMNMVKILLSTNVYMQGAVNYWSILYIILGGIGLSSILSAWFTRYLFKKLKKDFKMSVDNE